MKWLILAGVLAFMAAPAATWAAAPTFTFVPSASSVTFHVKASTPIQGRFDRWKSSATFTSTDPTTGHIQIEIDAGSVDTGSGLKDGVLKSDQFFDVKNHPSITFRSTKISETGAGAFTITGTLTIRGVSKPETLVLRATPDGTGGEVRGTMTFDRKDFGMNGGVPLVKIADGVDVIVKLTAKRTSGPPLVLKS